MDKWLYFEENKIIKKNCRIWRTADIGTHQFCINKTEEMNRSLLTQDCRMPTRHIFCMTRLIQEQLLSSNTQSSVKEDIVTKYPSLAALCKMVSPVEWSTQIFLTSAGIWWTKPSPADFITDDDDDNGVLVLMLVELSAISCNNNNNNSCYI